MAHPLKFRNVSYNGTPNRPHQAEELHIGYASLPKPNRIISRSHSFYHEPIPIQQVNNQPINIQQSLNPPISSQQSSSYPLTINGKRLSEHIIEVRSIDILFTIIDYFFRVR